MYTIHAVQIKVHSVIIIIIILATIKVKSICTIYSSTHKLMHTIMSCEVAIIRKSNNTMGHDHTKV